MPIVFFHIGVTVEVLRKRLASFPLIFLLLSQQLLRGLLYALVALAWTQHVLTAFLWLADRGCLAFLLAKATAESSQHLLLVGVDGSATAQHLPDALLVDGLALVVELELVLGASHAENFESVDLGHEFGRRFRQKFWELLEEDMREARAEIGPVNVYLALARNVYILTPGAVDLDTRGGEFLADADRQYVVSLAEDPRAVGEGGEHIFLLHHGEAPWRNDEPCMDETIQVHGGLIDLEEVLVVQIFGVGAVSG